MRKCESVPFIASIALGNPPPPRACTDLRVCNTPPPLPQERSSPVASSTLHTPRSAARLLAHFTRVQRTSSTVCLRPHTLLLLLTKKAAAAATPPLHLWFLLLISGPTSLFAPKLFSVSIFQHTLKPFKLSTRSDCCAIAASRFVHSQRACACAALFPARRAVPHSCLKVGLKLFARDFDLGGSCAAPFAPSDIADCVPVCKPSPLQSKDVRMLLEHGKMFLRASAFPHAFEYFRQAQERAVHTCGVLHADNADAFAHLAKVAHKFGEHGQALQFLQSSLSIRCGEVCFWAVCDVSRARVFCPRVPSCDFNISYQRARSRPRLF